MKEKTFKTALIVAILSITVIAYGDVQMDLITGESRYFAEDVFMLKLDLAINEDAGFYGDVYLVVVDPNGTIYFAPGWQQDVKPVLENFFFPLTVDLKSALIIEVGIPNLSFPMTDKGEYIFAIGITKPKTFDFIKIASVTTKYLGEREWMVLDKDDGILDYIINVIDDKYGGGCWLGANAWDGPYQLYHYKDGVLKGYDHDNNGLGSTFNSGMAYDSQNNFWASSYGIHKYLPVEDKFVWYFPPEDQFPFGKMINSMISGKDNILWVGTLNGLGCYDVENDSWKFYYQNDGLFVNLIWDIAFDFNGNLWIVCNNSDTSVGGVCKFDGEKFETFAHPFYFKHYIFHHVAVDSEGCVWVGGVDDRNYVYRYVNGEWIEYTEADGLPSIEVTAFYLDRFGKFWIAPDSLEKGPVQFINGSFYPVVSEIHDLGMRILRYIYQDSENNYWFVGTPGTALRWGSD